MTPDARERTITVLLAVECIVEGEADAGGIAQTVTTFAQFADCHYQRTIIKPRAVGLIRHDERWHEPGRDLRRSPDA